MLNFLSRLLGKKHPVSQTVPEKKQEPSASQDEKLKALETAAALPDDDQAIVAFLLACRYADARYAAAQKIRSRQAMEQVRDAMQKTDRRVYRLMQTRMSDMARTEAQAASMEQVVDTAAALLDDPALTPNLVVDLDRKWQSAASGEPEKWQTGLWMRFESLRNQLEGRLTAQLQLQRTVKSAYGEMTALENRVDMTPQERKESLDAFTESLTQWQQSPEWFSLPRHLVSAVDEKLSALAEASARFEQEFERMQQCAAWLDEMEAADVSQLEKTVLEKEWTAFRPSGVLAQWTDLQARFDALCLRLPVPKVEEVVLELPSINESSSVVQADILARFDAALAAMQQAVEAGSIQEAAMHDEVLRGLDTEHTDIGDERQEKLSHLRSELRRLRGWARWSGQLSREKLIHFVQELPEQNLEINALAEEVIHAREQWKALNAVAGMATREQWTEFDTACNVAYAPVLEHARLQAQEKEKNIEYAETLIEKVAVFAGEFETRLAAVTEQLESFDWKNVINFYRQMTQAWRKLGIVGRKEKKRLDEAFSAAMLPVREKLYEQTQLEIGRREQLIAEVGEIDPDNKESGKLLRAVQEKWQACARAFPLDNREDRKLWARFREACEQLHMRRMEKNRAHDEERLQHLREKEVVCAELEALSGSDNAGMLEHRLGELLGQWKNLGFVPRDAEADLRKRLDDAVAACRDRIRRLKSEKMYEALGGLADKLALCCAMERQIAAFCQDTGEDTGDMVSEDEEYETAWKALPQLPDEMETVLSHRFYNGLKAMANRNMAYGRRLLGNVDAMKDNILRFEIVYGLDSPEYLQEARLKKQMEVLQDSLGGGDRTRAIEATRQLLELPALSDEEDIRRIDTLVRKMNKPG